MFFYKITLSLVFMLPLIGCNSIPAPISSRPELIPSSSAKSILEDYFGAQWVSNPVGLSHSATCAVQRGGIIGYFQGYPLISLPLSDFNHVAFFEHREHSTILLTRYTAFGLTAAPDCKNSHVTYEIRGQYNLEDAERVATALRALGADIPVE
jgi:hypothetical protein